MTRPIAIYAGGTTELRQAAVREDGAVFVRAQRVVYTPRSGTHLGWSPWREHGRVNPLDLPDHIPLGFATLRMADPDGPCINDRALFDRQGRIRAKVPD